LGAIPSMQAERQRLVQIDGAMPRSDARPDGCAFHPRCSAAQANCGTTRPAPSRVGQQEVSCWWPLVADKVMGRG
jgi:peptide/nickel transport system ATP-binding protein